MVRILNLVGDVKKETEHAKNGKIDLKMGDIPILSKIIVADENIELVEGKTVSVKIKEIEIPAKHLATIGAYASNKYGHPISVGSEVHLPLSMDKKVNRAAFVAVINGKIEKGDLLGYLFISPVEIFNNFVK